MKKAILLDRDGVINYDSKFYIKSVDEFHYIPGSLEAICLLNKSGYQVGIATNQSGISRGLYTIDTLNFIHQKLCDDLEKMGGKIHAIEFCPHLPEVQCKCRKPQPEMLIKLMNFFEVSAQDTYFVGDRLTDVEAAIFAGVKPVLLSSSFYFEWDTAKYPHVLHYPSLSDFVKTVVLEQEKIMCP